MKKYLIDYLNRFVRYSNNRLLPSIERSLIIQRLQEINLTSKEKIVDDHGDNDIVVSLTTFGQRINEVYLTLESIGLQTVKPNKLVLWLAKDEFYGKELPNSLKNLIERGLEVCYCHDLKSYNKLIPSLKLFPNSNIVTVDDDIIYNRDLNETFLKNSKIYPKTILCALSKEISLKNGIVQSYNNWFLHDRGDAKVPGLNAMALGVGGVFYPSGCFSKEIFKSEVFMEICPFADDLWFKVVSLLNSTYTLNISNHFDRTSNRNIIFSAQEDSLSMRNVVKGENDIQFQKLIDYFGLDLTKILKY
jgi:hypothetical protein